MSGFHVNFNAMGQGAIDLQQETTEVSNALNDLQQQMAAVRSDLEGATAESYDVAMQNWALNLEDMRTLLNGAQVALGNMGDNYGTTDNREANEWRNLA
ncbi:WXG100 family type VII secretion target [Nocardiopsis flavescens]|uniref:ESAT-6-like protein n=1 Tax=Nocardiopsis flavescens TaxID=758803 RepID=A0A1M6V0B3_9ACTN|nr:WXG100 family type VII secretion target [Nocardiopsis flavescens]SHK74893.1 WXG100 family type VII secretion target [Nocardiopsis flavescens]